MDLGNKFYCRQCGSEHVRVLAWVNPNNNEFDTYVSDNWEEEDMYCEDCGDHTSFITPLQLADELRDVEKDKDGNILDYVGWFRPGTPALDIRVWIDEHLKE